MEKIWKTEHIDFSLKLKIFEVSVKTVRLYGCESWIIDDNLETKLNTQHLATEKYLASGDSIVSTMKSSYP